MGKRIKLDLIGKKSCTTDLWGKSKERLVKQKVWTKKVVFYIQKYKDQFLNKKHLYRWMSISFWLIDWLILKACQPI